ncbi:MAG: hypothetical protein HGB08_04785 [Candidatus Moranbacteria bacterium]|nr:hypothetical protein [Candidatus Moranbacteria bacterium]
MLSVVYAMVFGKAGTKKQPFLGCFWVSKISFSYIPDTHKQPKGLGYAGRGKLVVIAVPFMR